MAVFFSYFIYFAGLGGIFYFFVYKRLKFKNRESGVPFFFENDCLVLNTGSPYPVPFADIDHVELHYSQKELESRISYHMWLWVVRKNGKTKKVYYMGSTTYVTPIGWKEKLEEQGLLVEMVDK